MKPVFTHISVKFYLLVVFCNLNFISSFGSDNIDSLLRVATKTNKSVEWNEVAEYYNQHADTLQMRLAVEKAMKSATRENNNDETGRALLIWSQYFDYMGKASKSMEYLEKAFVYADKSESKSLPAETAGLAGYFYNEAGKYEQAVASLKKSAGLFRQIDGMEDRIATSYVNIAYSFLKMNVPDSVIFYNHRALEFAEIARDTVTLTEVANQLGLLYARKENYPEALRYYEISLNLNQLSKNNQKIPYALLNIAMLYNHRGDRDKAMEFAQKSVEKAKECGDMSTYAKILSIAADIYSSAGTPRQTIETAKASLRLLEESPFYQYSCLINLAGSYLLLDKLDSCNYYLSEAEKYHEYNFFVTQSRYYTVKGQILIRTGKYKEAIPYLEKVADLRMNVEKQTIGKGSVYNNLSIAYEIGLHDYRKALEYKKKAYDINDSIYRKEVTTALSDFQVKYQVSEKELEITRLNLLQEQDRYERAKLIIWLIVIAGLLLASGLYSLLIRWKKQTEKVILNGKIEEKERQYDALVSDMELRQVKYYLNGLEAERSRLAKELHDNVANNLLTVELKMKTPGASQEEISETLENLRIQVRQISHEMLPPAFQETGLPELIEHFVLERNDLSGPCFEFFLSPEEGWEQLPHETALELYRIMQEACGNALKHAQASSVIITLTRTGGNIELTVADNGQGITDAEQNKGIGLRLIGERAAGQRGRLEITGLPEKGTTVKVVIPGSYQP